MLVLTRYVRDGRSRSRPVAAPLGTLGRDAVLMARDPLGTLPRTLRGRCARFGLSDRFGVRSEEYWSGSATRSVRPKGHAKKFPRLKPRINGNFGLGSLRADLEIDCLAGVPEEIRTPDPRFVV
jgi:hypothetical protein